MSLPNEVVIELTRKCNLDCNFCFNKQENNKIIKGLSKDDVVNILKDAAKSGIGAVRFTGGEPLLRDDLIEIVKKAKSLGLYTILNSNGLLINATNKYILKHIDLILISLHNTLLFNEIKHILGILNEFNTATMLATIVTPENIAKLELFYKFVSKIKYNNFKKWFLLRPVPNMHNREPIPSKEIRKLYRLVCYCNKKYAMNIKIANALPFCAVNEDLSSICSGGKYDSGYTRLFIDCQGYYKIDYFSQYALGNITRNNILEIWNLKLMKDIRSCKKNSKDCVGCYYLNNCKGGLLDIEYLRNPRNINPIVSVIIPTFNAPERLSLLIKSLENQSYKNFEIIIVDDGSTDNTKDMVKHLQVHSKARIRYFYLGNTDIFGAGIARNYGAKMAKGRILIFLDQDAVADYRLIEKHLEAQEHNDIVLGYYAGYNNLDSHYNFNNLRDKVYKKEIITPILPDFRKNVFMNQNLYQHKVWQYFVSANFAIKKSLFLDYLFDEEIKQWGGQDIDLGYRLFRDGKPLSFFEGCLAYNSSNDDMINRRKFISCMQVLIYLYKKYRTEELKNYCFERFYFTPLEIRQNAELINKDGKLIFKEPKIYAFIRIDDIDKKNKQLLNLLDFTISNAIPVNLQVIPARLKENLIIFLKALKRRYPNLISINQHGFSHENHNLKKIPKYEFGPSRSYYAQKKDILKGMDILKKAFDNNFIKIFTPPFQGYDENTLRILKEYGYSFVSLGDNHSSDKSNLMDLPINLDLIKSYNPLTFFTIEELFDKLKHIYNFLPYIGIVLHPQLIDINGLRKLRKLIFLMKNDRTKFILMEDLGMRLFSKDKTEIYIDKNDVSKVTFGKDFKKLKNNIISVSKLIRQINFDISVVQYLKQDELNDFRENFFQIISYLRHNKVLIDYDNIRLQSIKYQQLLIGPKILHLNIIDNCNYKCVFCLTNSLMLSPDERLPINKPLEYKIIKNIINQAYSIGTDTLMLSGGGGEPFIHPDIDSIICYAASKDFNIEISTNASMTKKIFNLSRKNRLSFLVNLCAITPKKYKLIHGGNRKIFLRTLNNIKYLSDNFPVTLSYIIIKHNYMDIFNFFVLAKSLNVKNIYLKFPTLYEKNQRELLLTFKLCKALMLKIPQIKQFAKENYINSNIAQIEQSLLNKRADIFYPSSITHIAEIKRCLNSWFYAKIRSNKKIYTCCMENEPIGNINLSGFKQSYFSRYSVSHAIRGKNGIDISSGEWHKCKFCYKVLSLNNK